MSSLHQLLGAIVVLALLAVAVWGLVLRVQGQDTAPDLVWRAHRWIENLLILQIAGGILLLVMGERVVGGPMAWLHYLLGSILPLLALSGGRAVGLRRRKRGHRQYPAMAWGALVAWGMTLGSLVA